MIIVDQDTKDLFLEKIKTLLTRGESVQTMKTVNTKKIIRDGNDDITETSEINTSDRTTQLKPCPKWVYDLIIKSLSIESAITLLQSQGYIVADPNYTPEVSNVGNSRGLSDFAITELRSKLLGIEMTPIEQVEVTD